MEGEVSVVVAEVEARHLVQCLLLISFGRSRLVFWLCVDRSGVRMEGGEWICEEVNVMMRLSGSLAVES